MSVARPRTVLILATVGSLVRPPMAVAADDEAPTVTPYRPTVSNPAALPVPGWLDMEFGVNRQHPGDGSRITSLPFLLKYAVNPDFGVLLGGDARVWVVGPGEAHSAGRGDTTFLLKHRWPLGDDPNRALGLEWGAKSPTARDGIGSGATDYLLNGIYSTRWRDNTIDVNLSATHLGTVDAGGRRQLGWAAALAREVGAGWSLAGELSGSARHGTTGASQALVAVAYAISPRVTIDAGFAVGLSRAAPDRNVFLGLSLLSANLR